MYQDLMAQHIWLLEWLPCSISTVYKAVCTATQAPVIIKAYEKARMKPKNHARLEREVRLMQHLGGAEGMVDLYAVFEDMSHKYLVGLSMSRAT